MAAGIWYPECAGFTLAGLDRVEYVSQFEMKLLPE